MPIVASISGVLHGRRVEIASCCDVRVAGAAAAFGAPLPSWLPMALREAQLVAAAVGETAARQMLLEAATFTAADMLARGFLSRVVPDDDVPPKPWPAPAASPPWPGRRTHEQTSASSIKTPPALDGKRQQLLK